MINLNSVHLHMKSCVFDFMAVFDFVFFLYFLLFSNLKTIQADSVQFSDMFEVFRLLCVRQITRCEIIIFINYHCILQLHKLVNVEIDTNSNCNLFFW